MKQSLQRTAGLGFLALLGLTVTVSLGSCYNPNIVNGGLHCSEGGRCPDGFVCHPTGRCYRPDSGPTDCGSTQLCNDPPPAGQACNVVCQTGCGCGQRCNVAGSSSRCVAGGDKTLGQPCTFTYSGEPGFDDCQPGLICLSETAKACAGLNRCYRLCSSDDQCNKPDPNVRCLVQVTQPNAPVSFLACEVPHQACDPVAKTGCLSSLLTCFVLSAGQTLCDCQTNVAKLPPDKAGLEGSACTAYSDCKPGLTCISLPGDGGAVTSTCRPVCAVAKPACATAGTSCKPIAGDYGYCAP